MQGEYWRQRARETQKFRYNSDEVTYHVFKDDNNNPHPDDLGVWFKDDIFVSDRVPDPLKDIIAYHEWIEVQGMKKHGFPKTGTPEGNKLLEVLHKKAIEKEMELAAYRKVLELYKSWWIDIEKIFGPRC